MTYGINVILQRRTFNSSPPGQNGRQFYRRHFCRQCIFVNETFCILTKISLKFVPDGPIDNKAAPVPVMAWRQTSDKPLPESMLTQFTDELNHLSSKATQFSAVAIHQSWLSVVIRFGRTLGDGPPWSVPYQWTLCYYISSWMTPHQTLQWRHNEDNGVSNHRCLERFTQPFVQAQIKDIPSCVFFMMFYFRQQNNVLRMYDVLVVIVGHLLDHCNIWKRIVFSLTGRWLPITNSPTSLHDVIPSDSLPWNCHTREVRLLMHYVLLVLISYMVDDMVTLSSR